MKSFDRHRTAVVSVYMYTFFTAWKVYTQAVCAGGIVDLLLRNWRCREEIIDREQEKVKQDMGFNSFSRFVRKIINLEESPEVEGSIPVFESREEEEEEELVGRNWRRGEKNMRSR